MLHEFLPKESLSSHIATVTLLFTLFSTDASTVLMLAALIILKIELQCCDVGDVIQGNYVTVVSR